MTLPGSESATLTPVGTSSMVLPVLATKLRAPRVRTALVQRPRLQALLQRGLDRPLSLISAPAGFGKTSLLGAWRVATGGHDCCLAWVSLDEADNDPVRFWQYAVAAFDSVLPGVGEGAQSLLRSISQSPSGQGGVGWLEAVATALINDLAAVEELQNAVEQTLVLALDDYHTIRNPVIHDSIAFFVEHLPPHVHLVILTRADPPLPLARMRARDQLVEIRASDLRFSADETEAFLNRVMALGLPADAVKSLESRTEGWPAGLLLAALSLQGREEPFRDRFINDFKGTQHHVFAYLVEEVLGRQPAELQAFLLRTSILSYLTAPLCDAILGVDTGDPSRTAAFPAAHPTSSFSQAMLAQLERENLFVVPLDEDRRWYRYHPLFAEALRARLAQAEPDSLSELHRRAAAWYESQGQVPDAVRHFFSTGDLEHVGRLIEATYKRLMMNGEMVTLRAWLDALPRELLRGRPRLALAYAWSLAYSGPHDLQEQALSWVEASLGEEAGDAVGDGGPIGPQNAADRVLRGEMLALRATGASLRWQSKLAIELAQQALWLLWPDDWAEFFQDEPVAPATLEDIWLRAVVLQALGNAHRLDGNVHAAETTYREVLRLTLGDGVLPPFPMMALTASIRLGQVLINRGRLRDTEALYRETLDQVRSHGGELLLFAGEMFIRLGEVLSEQHRLAEAEESIRQGIDLCHRAVNPMPEVAGYLALAGVTWARGAADAARAELGRAEQIVLHGGRDHLMALVAVRRAWLGLVTGEMSGAARWADELPRLRAAREEWPRHIREAEDVLLAGIRLAQGRPAESLALLRAILQDAEAAGRTAIVIEVLALEAMACGALGGAEQARRTLARSLTLAAPEGYVRMFTEKGEAMMRLLSDMTAARCGSAVAGYATALLAEVGGGMLGDSSVPHPVLNAHPLVEPLTAREIEILRLLASGASNGDIAARYVLSVGTVKGHVNHILGKLGVRNRTEAALRARELDLLQT